MWTGRRLSPRATSPGAFHEIRATTCILRVQASGRSGWGSGYAIRLAVGLAAGFAIGPTYEQERGYYYEYKDILDFWNSSKRLSGSNNIPGI